MNPLWRKLESLLSQLHPGKSDKSSAARICELSLRLLHEGARRIDTWFYLPGRGRYYVLPLAPSPELDFQRAAKPGDAITLTLSGNAVTPDCPVVVAASNALYTLYVLRDPEMKVAAVVPGAQNPCRPHPGMCFRCPSENINRNRLLDVIWEGKTVPMLRIAVKTSANFQDRTITCLSSGLSRMCAAES